MKLSDLILLSTKTFLSRPTRTFLTIFGLSIGIGTILFLVSLGYGLQNIILNKITSADALLNLEIRADGASLLSKDTVKKISEIEGVEEVNPIINLDAQISSGNLAGGALIRAVKPSFFRFEGINASYGNLFNNNNYAAVLSSTAVKLLNFSPEEAIGKEITLNLYISNVDADGAEEIKTFPRIEKYTITGIIPDENSSYLYIPIDGLTDLNIDIYSAIKVKVSQNSYLSSVKSQINNMGFLVSSLSDTISQTKKIFLAIQIILALFGLAALIVSIIGMHNTLTAILEQKTNEIIIMRSTGASANDIRFLFLIESFLMSLFGGLSGIILGFAGNKITNFGFNYLAGGFNGQSLNLFYLPIWLLGLFIIIPPFAGLLIGLYPSIRAAKITSFEAYPKAPEEKFPEKQPEMPEKTPPAIIQEKPAQEIIQKKSPEIPPEMPKETPQNQ